MSCKLFNRLKDIKKAKNFAHWNMAKALPQIPGCNYHCFAITLSFIKLNLFPQNGHWLKWLHKYINPCLVILFLLSSYQFLLLSNQNQSNSFYSISQQSLWYKQRKKHFSAMIKYHALKYFSPRMAFSGILWVAPKKIFLLPGA